MLFEFFNAFPVRPSIFCPLLLIVVIVNMGMAVQNGQPVTTASIFAPASRCTAVDRTASADSSNKYAPWTPLE